MTSPSNRASRVEAVRVRIASGYYDRADVKSKLADAVLGLMRRR